jgi:hypothetical protein
MSPKTIVAAAEPKIGPAIYIQIDASLPETKAGHNERGALDPMW